MASRRHPGGGVTGGSGAQEENLFRRVAFAIIDDHNAFHRGSPEGNYLPFERALAGS